MMYLAIFRTTVDEVKCATQPNEPDIFEHLVLDVSRLKTDRPKLSDKSLQPILSGAINSTAIPFLLALAGTFSDMLWSGASFGIERTSIE